MDIGPDAVPKASTRKRYPGTCTLSASKPRLLVIFFTLDDSNKENRSTKSQSAGSQPRKAESKTAANVKQSKDAITRAFEKDVTDSDATESDSSWYEQVEDDSSEEPSALEVNRCFFTTILTSQCYTNFICGTLRPQHGLAHSALTRLNLMELD